MDPTVQHTSKHTRDTVSLAVGARLGGGAWDLPGLAEASTRGAAICTPTPSPLSPLLIPRRSGSCRVRPSASGSPTLSRLQNSFHGRIGLHRMSTPVLFIHPSLMDARSLPRLTPR